MCFLELNTFRMKLPHQIEWMYSAVVHWGSSPLSYLEMVQMNDKGPQKIFEFMTRTINVFREALRVVEKLWTWIYGYTYQDFQ